MDLFGNSSSSGMLLSVEDQIRMDLIRNEHYLIFHTDLCHFFQVFFTPTQDLMGCEDYTTKILYTLLPTFEVLVIYMPASIFFYQRIFYYYTANCLWNVIKLQNIQESGSESYLPALCRSSSGLPWSEQHQGTSSCAKFPASNHNISLPIPVLPQSNLPVWMYIPIYLPPLFFACIDDRLGSFEIHISYP